MSCAAIRLARGGLLGVTTTHPLPTPRLTWVPSANHPTLCSPTHAPPVQHTAVKGKESELVKPFTPFVMDTDETDGDGTNDIGHANVHSCGNQVGFCVPFIGNDGELATHTSADKDSWGWDNADNPVVGSVTFGSDLILSKDYSPYTIIAHGRFEFTGADGAKWRMDMAAAHLGVVVKPQTREKTLDMGVIMIGTIVGVLALVFQVGLLAYTTFHYSNKIMKLSQVNVLLIMILSGMLGTVIVMLTFGEVSDSMCPMKGFVTVPLTFMVGLLYGKVHKAQDAVPCDPK